MEDSIALFLAAVNGEQKTTYAKPRLPPPPEHLAANLLTVRMRQGLTQEQLARKAGVSPERVSCIERGKRVRFETLRLIAKALGVAVRDLCGDKL